MLHLKEFMDERIGIINDELAKYINKLNAPSNLKKSMNYSLMAGGKRIRPILLFATLQAFQKNLNLGLPVACALEMIHTYSLIHDDLPCMDDDDLRRGKPTNHKVFGEAVAVLAGDGLLTYSFQIIMESDQFTPEQKVALVYELAKAAGPEGMVAGQLADMEGENGNLSLQELEYIHLHKTGKLLAFPIIAATILADCDREVKKELAEYAKHIGLAFQIQDDILDVEGTTEKLGKTAGSDTENNKSTYITLLSLEGAKEKLNEHLSKARAILERLPIDTTLLLEITDLIGKREN